MDDQTTPSDEFAAHVEVVRQFLGRMKQRSDSYRAIGKKLDKGEISYQEWVDQINAETRQIYTEFVQCKKEPKAECFSGHYHPTHNKVIEVAKGRQRVFVVVQRHLPPHDKVRYAVVSTDEGLRILEKCERFSEYEEKYVKWHLQL